MYSKVNLRRLNTFLILFDTFINSSKFLSEFGNSKDVVDLYEKFFSKQQSTSINQHPKALYRLTLTKDWENHLNIYALAALRALPEIYDSNIYNRLVLNIAIHTYNEK